jgi:hypothetical protein
MTADYVIVHTHGETGLHGHGAVVLHDGSTFEENVAYADMLNESNAFDGHWAVHHLGDEVAP